VRVRDQSEITTSYEKPVADIVGKKELQRKKKEKKQYEKNVLSFYVSTVQSFEVSTENVGVEWDSKYVYYTHAENTLLCYI